MIPSALQMEERRKALAAHMQERRAAADFHASVRDYHARAATEAGNEAARCETRLEFLDAAIAERKRQDAESLREIREVPAADQGNPGR